MMLRGFFLCRSYVYSKRLGGLFLHRGIQPGQCIVMPLAEAILVSFEAGADNVYCCVFLDG